MLIKSQVKSGRLDAEFLAKVIENVLSLLEKVFKLYQQNQQSRQLEKTNRVIQRIGTSLNLEETLDQLLDGAMEVIEAERGFITILDNDKLIVQSARNLNQQSLDEIYSNTVVKHVIDSGESVISSNVQEDPRFRNAASIVTQSIHCVIAHPIHDGTNIIGAIYCDSRMIAGMFNENDLEVLNSLADKTAMMIWKAHQFTALETRLEELEKNELVYSSQITHLTSQLNQLQSVIADYSGSVNYRGVNDSNHELIGLSQRLYLIKELYREDVNLRRKASRKLIEIADTTYVDDLLKALNNEDIIVRRNIARSLNNIKTDKSLESLAQIINDEDKVVRQIALKAIVELDKEQYTSQLITALRDKEPKIRALAIKGLKHFLSEAVIFDLIKMLEDENQIVRKNASDVLKNASYSVLSSTLEHYSDFIPKGCISLLSQFDDPLSIPVLISALQVSNIEVRQEAAIRLKQLGEEHLLNALEDDRDRVRITVIEELAKETSELGFQKLRNLIQAKSSDVKHAALKALGNLKDRGGLQNILQAVNDDDTEVKHTAIKVVSDLVNETDIPKVLELYSEIENDELRSSIFVILQNFGEENVVSYLNDKSEEVRCAIIQVIDNTHNTSYIPNLITLLGDNSKSVRRSAAKTIIGMGEQYILEALKDKRSSIRKGAAEILEVYPVKNCNPILLNLLHDHSLTVRRTAAETLKLISDVSCIPDLLRASNHRDEVVRAMVIEALGHLGEEIVLPRILEALYDRSEKVRLAAAKSLKHFGNTFSISDLLIALQDSDPLVRKASAETISHIVKNQITPQLGSETGESELPSPHLGEVIKQAFVDQNNEENLLFLYLRPYHTDPITENVRSMAIKQDVAGLIRVLINPNENFIVRRAVIMILMNMRDERAVKPLIESLGDEHYSIRRMAAVALGELGNNQAINPLVSMLDDSEAIVRNAVAYALSRLGWSQK